MNAQEKLNKINEMLAMGWDVYVCTAYKATRITPKAAAKWKATGRDVMCVMNNKLMIASGKNYLIADGCSIRFAK